MTLTGSFQIEDEQGEFLVRLARKAIIEYLKSNIKISPPPETPGKLREKCGVFVTLNRVTAKGGRELRGCIGYPEPVMPLVKATIDSAINAAVGDPRFPPVRLGELNQIVIEVSVLTPPQLVKVESLRDYPHQIRIGVDGIIVEKGFYRGLLLPQVPVEWGWDSEEFLSHGCLKAGLPPDAWLVPGTKIYKFQAIIFEEEKPSGEVNRRTLKGCMG
ncbi:TPA: TIGR00296 family protein [Candidatus Bathyarchaeota archaeon]|nr:TIGR00296 family protein [Candidatus Bathyarchaeota archaeon]